MLSCQPARPPIHSHTRSQVGCAPHLQDVGSFLLLHSITIISPCCTPIARLCRLFLPCQFASLSVLLLCTEARLDSPQPQPKTGRATRHPISYTAQGAGGGPSFSPKKQLHARGHGHEPFLHKPHKAVELRGPGLKASTSRGHKVISHLPAICTSTLPLRSPHPQSHRGPRIPIWPTRTCALSPAPGAFRCLTFRQRRFIQPSAKACSPLRNPPIDRSTAIPSRRRTRYPCARVSGTATA